MSDKSILEHITALVAEEHALREGPLKGDAEAERMRQLETQLDQCWDLLRQRRARRDAGQDPDTAAARPPDVVERYEQ